MTPNIIFTEIISAAQHFVWEKTVFLSDQYFNGNGNNMKRLGKEYINYEIVKTKKSKSINYSANKVGLQKLSQSWPDPDHDLISSMTTLQQ